MSFFLVKGAAAQAMLAAPGHTAEGIAMNAPNIPTQASVCHVLVVIDGRTEEVTNVVKINRFELPAFTLQFDVPVEHDPDMLDRYVVGPDDQTFLKAYLDDPVDFNFTNNGYWIEAVNVR